MTSIDDFTAQALGLVELPAPPPLWSAVAGYATCRPELHHGADGRAWARFGLALPKIDDTAWEDASHFCYVVAIGELAENLATSVTEGARLIAIGRLEPYWVGEGAERYGWTLRADEVGISIEGNPVES